MDVNDNKVGEDGDTNVVSLETNNSFFKHAPFLQIYNNLDDAANDNGKVEACPLPNLPNWRIQALKLGEYYSSSLSSSAYTTEDDDAANENKDSHLGEFVPPDEELIQKIVKQVESMFSDSFVYRDAFMLKHIRRGTGGSVSLRLITSIRKVKSLTQDYRIVAYALKNSKELEVNEDESKVRRITPLPDNFDSGQAQAILLTGMPRDGTIHDKVDETVQLISTLLKKRNPEDSGSSLSNAPSIRIIKEATHIPSAYKGEYDSLFSFEDCYCIILDFFGFEKLEISSIQNVLKPSGPEEDRWKEGIGVHELPGIKADPSRRKKTRKGKDGHAQDAEDKAPTGKSTPKMGLSPLPHHRVNAHSNSPNRSLLDNSSGSCNRLNVSSPWSTPGSSPRGSPCFRRRIKPGPSPLTVEAVVNSSGGESPAGSPWPTRKLRNQIGQLPIRRAIFSEHEAKNSPMVTVTRLPRGPEEGRGFQLVRTLVQGS